MEQTIGEILKRARQSKGYTLDDLQQITKIQKRYLIAIEENEFDLLPGDFYTKAFIKQVAETVGIDGNLLLEQVPLYPQSVVQPEPQPQMVEEPVKKEKAVQTRVQTNQESQSRERQTWNIVKNYLPTIVIAMLAVAIIVAIAQSVLNGRNANQPVTAPTTAQVQTTGETSESSAAETTQAEETTTTTTAETTTQSGVTSVQYSYANGNSLYYTARVSRFPANLVITNRAQTDLWANVTADRRVIADGVPSTGQQLTASVPEGTNTITLSFGYTPNGTITLDGQEVQIPQGQSATTIYITLQ